MQQIKIIINGITIKDDYSTDPSYLIKCELEEELEDVIPSVSIEVKKSIHDLLTLSQSQIVEIYTGSTPVRVFYGYILEIKNEGATTKIEAIMETANLLRRKVNKIYTSTEAHLGKNELIVEDLIERAGLTANVVTPTETNIIDEFKCIHATIWERIVSLMKAIDYQIRYDPVTRIVHYEPRGFTDNNTTLTVRQEIIGLPEWKEVTDGMINDLRIDGATTETQITESGTIGTTDGWTANSIELTKTPNIVELIVNSVQLIGGSKDASSGHDYWVDRENKKIIPKTGTTFTTHPAVVNYSWSAPAPVQDFRQDSIDKYGKFEEVFNFTDISSVADAESRIEKLLDSRAEPFLTGTLKVKENNLKIGEIVTVVDNLSTPNINQKFVVSQIKKVYPSGFDEIKVGDKEWKLEDDIIEIDNRIKRLEENFIRNQDLLLQLVRISDDSTTNVEFPTERYLKVFEKNIGGDVGIWGNSDFGIWGVMKWGTDNDQSFILGKGKLGLNALGSKTSEEVLKVVKSFEHYIEDFSDNDFEDTDETDADWGVILSFTSGQIAQSSQISYKEKTITSATLTATEDSGSFDYEMTADGTNWESVTSGVAHTFTNTGNNLKWRITENASSTGEITKLEIIY